MSVQEKMREEASGIVKTVGASPVKSSDDCGAFLCRPCEGMATWLGAGGNQCANRLVHEQVKKEMKRKAGSEPGKGKKVGLNALSKVFAGFERPEDARAFLEDLCTPAELEALIDRWRVVPLLLQGLPYREIHERTRVSATTIGRVARTLENGAGGYGKAVIRHFPHLKIADR